MGKKRRIRTGAGDVVPTPGPLHKQIEKANMAKPKFKAHKQSRDDDRDDKHDKHVDAALCTKILKEAQKQWHEEGGGSDVEDQNSEASDQDGEEMARHANELAGQIAQIDPLDEADFDRFSRKRATGETLYDMIQTKKRESSNINTPIEIEGLDPSVVALYTEIGQVMEKYRSGKVPKAFKIIPAMANWEQLLELTCPEKWSSAAMLQAARTFAATGTPSQCQRFYNLILLPRVRDEIDEFKKLNFHLYQCLFKAMFKPAAFFKGLLLPLCKSGTCTLREAVIIGSVLRKISIPLLHAAAAMLSIAEMEYSGANSYILRILIEKNYTLPSRALDGLVYHFLGMRSHQGELPVIWHQSLLAFVERYSSDISDEQREVLIDLTKVQNHYQITPEIQRILRSAEPRSGESEPGLLPRSKLTREDEMEV